MGEIVISVDLIVGCRPNFVKAAALVEAAKKYPEIKIRLVHTGQHGHEMSEPFFEQLGLPDPIHFAVRYSSARTFGGMISDLSALWAAYPPDFAMVVGDTDSTAAGAIAAAKIGIPILHVEAGLRSGDAVQEDLNRRLVDHLAQRHYTTTEEARQTLIKEGRSPESTIFVGNVMIDTLLRFKDQGVEAFRKLNLFLNPDQEYAVLTVHRAETVGDKETMDRILDAARATKTNIIFPMHPRTRKEYGEPFGIIVAEPYPYLEFIGLIAGAKFVMTDSGGVQEETTVLGVPCLTLRNTTERPETVLEGSNYIVGTSVKKILSIVDALDCHEGSRIPKFWDGHAADRIMEDLVKL